MWPIDERVGAVAAAAVLGCGQRVASMDNPAMISSSHREGYGLDTRLPTPGSSSSKLGWKCTLCAGTIEVD